MNLVFEDGVGQLGTHDTDAPAGVALEFDDLVGGVDDVLVKLAPVLRVAVRSIAGRRAHVFQPCTSDVDAAPDRHARITVFTDDIAAPVPQDTKQRVNIRLKIVQELTSSQPTLHTNGRQEFKKISI